MAIKECVICGERFDAHLGNQVTCSRRCYRKKSLLDNPEKHRERVRKWRDDNREKERLAAKEKRDSNRELYREKSRQQYAANRENKLKSAKRYRDKNLDLCRKKYREYHSKNRERLKCKMREYHNSQSAAASMLNLMGTMIQINERGITNETDQPE